MSTETTLTHVASGILLAFEKCNVFFILLGLQAMFNMVNHAELRHKPKNRNGLDAEVGGIIHLAQDTIYPQQVPHAYRLEPILLTTYTLPQVI